MKKQAFLSILMLSSVISLQIFSIQSWNTSIVGSDIKEHSLELLAKIVDDAKKGQSDAFSILLRNPLYRECHQSDAFNAAMAKALVVFVNNGDLESIKHLYKLGANLNIIVEPSDLDDLNILKEKTSLIGLAVTKKHWHIVKFLLDNDVYNLYGLRGCLFDPATGSFVYALDSLYNMLKEVARDNNVEMFRYLLIEYGIKRHGETAIDYDEKKLLQIDLLNIDAHKKFFKILEKHNPQFVVIKDYNKTRI